MAVTQFNQLPPQLQNASPQAIMEYYTKLAKEKGAAGIEEATAEINAFDKETKASQAARNQNVKLKEEQKKEINKKAKEQGKRMAAENTRAAVKAQEQSQTPKPLPQAVRPPVFDNKPESSEDTISEELLKEYGNNFFELYTFDNSVTNGKIRLAGVLKELPQFSMSTNWTQGPAASISDMVKSYMCSDLMEMVTAAGGYDRSWNALDEQSDRTYESTQEPSFELNFRVYTTENIGTVGFTTWQNWMKALALFAQPSIASKININAIGNNVVNGVLGNIDNVTSIAKNVTSMMSDTAKRDGVITAIGTGLEKLGNEIGDVTKKRDDINRVSGEANRKNYYGAKIWKLRLMPGLIQRPIIVYISNWSITYSKEINLDTEEPIYVDFKISCVMDQIPNAGTWMYYLNNNANANGVVTTYSKPIKPETPANYGVASKDKEYSEADMLTLSIPANYIWKKKSDKWIIEQIIKS